MPRIVQQVWGVSTATWLLLALAACEGAPARSKPWRHPRADAAPEPSAEVAGLAAEAHRLADRRRGRRELVVGVDRDPGALDPLRHPTADVVWLTRNTVFEPLVARGDSGALEPVLASSVSVSGDGRTVDIALRSDVRFHDGRPLGGADVRFSIASAAARGGLLGHDLGDLAGVEVPRPDRVRLHLRRPNHYVVRALAEIPIASAASYYAAGRGANPTPAGTGPYRIEAGEPARLVRWPDYRGEKAPAPAIEIRVEADRSRAIALAQVGDIDLLRSPGAAAAPRQGGPLSPLPWNPARFRYLAFNGRRELFSDTEVRRAAALAIDRRELVADGHGGRARAVAAPIWPGGPISAAAPEVPRPDRRAAAELLDRSGWVQKGGRSRQRDGKKLLAVVVVGERPDRARDLLLDQLREAGFVLDVRRLDDAALERAVDRGAFDLAVLEWRGFPDWDLSPLLERRGRVNHGHVGSPEIERALEALRQAPDAAARGRLAPRLAAALEASVPMVFLTAPQPLAVAGDRVEGIKAGSAIDLSALSRRGDR